MVRKIVRPIFPSGRTPAWDSSRTRKRVKHADHDLSDPEPSLLGKTVHETMQSEGASSYADITLICPDGTRIPAVRMILAMNSLYFEKLLLSSFAEKDCSEISISVSTKAVRELLEFMYIDDCPLIRIVRRGQYHSVVNEIARDLIDLAFAAEYTSMNRLLVRCQGAIKAFHSRHSHVSIIVLPVMRKHNAAWCQEIYQRALESCTASFLSALYYNCTLCNDACSVTHLDNSSAEEVFASILEKENNITPAWTYTYSNIFVILLLWASDGSIMDQILEDGGGTKLRISSCNEIKILDARMETARRIASWLDLTLFKPKFLSDTVELSGLVEKSAINEAYKKISLLCEDCICCSNGPRGV